jgi:DNA primase
MPNYQLYNDLHSEFILERVCQEKLFQKYLGLTPTEDARYRNPLRDDKNPTCSFSIRNGKWVFRDWSEPRWMDVFDIVQRIYDVDYPEALRIVAVDFGLLEGTTPQPVTIINRSNAKPVKTRLQVQVEPIKQHYKAYLSQFGITTKIAREFNVYGVKSLWKDKTLVYTHNKYDPALAYYFGLNQLNHTKWKVYFYYRVKHKFIGNTNRINGWIQLPKTADLLIITKSLKDVMVYKRLGLPAIAMQGESVLPEQQTIDELQSRFATIVTNYDFDKAGISTANQLKRLYGFSPMMFTNGRFGYPDHQAKDISDYVKKHGLANAERIVNHALKQII